MLEQRRQQYLSILGIENYVPRRIASGAAPSELLPNELLQVPSIVDSVASVDNADDIQKNEKEEVNGSTKLASVPDVSSLLQGLDGKNEKVETSLESTVGKEGPITDSSADNSTDSSALDTIQNKVSDDIEGLVPVSFTLSVWRVSEDCLVIDSREPGTALPTDRLLQNILRVMGYSIVQLPPSETIRWPVFIGDKFSRKKNGGVITKEQHDDEVKQARAMVQAYISAQVTKMPIKKLVVMGENSTLYSLEDISDFAKMQGTFIEDSLWQANIIIIPSLFSMLQEPLQKEIAWAALQNISR